MRRGLLCVTRSLPLLLALPLFVQPARADVDLKFSGSISSDMRFRIQGQERALPTPTPSQWTLLKNGFSRNENRIRAQLGIKLGQKIRGVADAELMLYGFSDLRDIDSATLRDRVDPYYLEVHAAYIDVYNLFGDVIPRFDLRLGRQTVPWGAADKFNPISNLNTLDLSDPLLFGRALANNMIRADWNPVGDLQITAVLVPVFRPAQLPRTAPFALLDPLRPAPVLDQGVRTALDNERAVYVPVKDPVTGVLLPAGRTLTVEADVLAPEVSAANMQVGGHVTWKLLGQDMGLSYYHGRFGIPVPAWSVSTGTLDQNVTLTQLVYPRMDVAGVEMAGSIERLGGMGYWIEAAVFFPGEVQLGLYDAITSPTAPRAMEYLPAADGRYYRNTLPVGAQGQRPLVIDRTPFPKATIGADYAFGGHVYVNIQYVHGFIDEFGGGRVARPRKDSIDVAAQPRVEARVGDYVVAGLDLKLLNERLLLRLFGVIKLPSVDLQTRLWDDWAPTGVLFPQIIWNVFDGTELMVGSFVMLGDRSTKFGDPAAGATEVFVRGKVSF
ncbi:MAG: hypothetical protein KA258_00110 [Deltaproteobacteria bacterium]|jgi:hypothetical protein|nr:hypothetical protein [Deltaproteobacteria bacterium]